MAYIDIRCDLEDSLIKLLSDKNLKNTAVLT